MITLHLLFLASMLVLAMAIGALTGWLIRDFIAHCDAAEAVYRETGRYDYEP